MDSFNRTFRSVILFFTWFIFSPLFLFLSIRWKKPKLFIRSILTIVAPFTLLSLVLISWYGYDYYYYNIKRGSRTEIEIKTGLCFPKYTTIEKRQQLIETSFNGDFTMGYVVKLDTVNIKDFFALINHEIESDLNQYSDNLHKSWGTCKEGFYSFSHNDTKEFLELEINPKIGVMKVTYGTL